MLFAKIISFVSIIFSPRLAESMEGVEKHSLYSFSFPVQDYSLVAGRELWVPDFNLPLTGVEAAISYFFLRLGLLICSRRVPLTFDVHGIFNKFLLTHRRDRKRPKNLQSDMYFVLCHSFMPLLT